MDRPSLAIRVAVTVQEGELKTLERFSDSSLTVVAEFPPEDNILANASTARKLTLMALFFGCSIP